MRVRMKLGTYYRWRALWDARRAVQEESRGNWSHRRAEWPIRRVPLELKLGVLCLIGLPTHFQFEFASRAGGHARKYACIGWKREWNLR
jgi:hypothetical protein